MIANAVYVLVRFLIIGFSVLVFGYGLGQLPQQLDYPSGNFNIPAIQYSVLAVVLIFQSYLFYQFIKKQMDIARENSAPVVTKSKPKPKSKSKKECKLTKKYYFK